MRTLTFCKMQGLGNDFMIVDSLAATHILETPVITRLAHRQLGIGFDQLLVVGPSSKADLHCQIFNADGSEAEQCGNGLRCVARFVHEEQKIRQSSFTIETKAGIFTVDIKNYNEISVNMGVPELASQPLMLSLDALPLSLTTLSLGNPHAIHRVNALQDVPVADWGAKMQVHPAFPQGVNAGFVEVLGRNELCLRTYERGVGETWACGSNACAAAVAGIANAWLEPTPVLVRLKYGDLQVSWEGAGHAVYLTGPAARVFNGEIEMRG